MHPYSIDTEERRNVIFYIAVFSILINSLLKSMILQYSNLTVIQVPTTFTIFGFVYILFDQYLWRLKMLFFCIKTPNFNGLWEGQYESSYEGMTVPAKLKIKQTWTRIEIISLNGEKETQSNSSMAGIFTKNGGEICLKFEYTNDSNPCMKDDRPSHSGFNCLKYDKDEKALSGHYYNDRNRKTYGSAYFQRVTEKKT